MWHVDGEKICLRIFVGKPVEMRVLVKHRRTSRWENNIEADVEKWDGRVDWIELAQAGDKLLLL
jgi:hypothetical protein